MHLITGTYNISVGFRMSGGAFYSSIGTIGTIGTNGITFIPLVKCISLQGLRIFPSASGWVGVHSTRPLVRLVPMEYHSNTFEIRSILWKQPKTEYKGDERLGSPKARLPQCILSLQLVELPPIGWKQKWAFSLLSRGLDCNTASGSEGNHYIRYWPVQPFTNRDGRSNPLPSLGGGY